MSSFWYTVAEGLTESERTRVAALPITEGEEETLAYLHSRNFPLAELLHDYVGLSAFEQSTLGARGLVLRVDKEIHALLERASSSSSSSSAPISSGIRMAIHLLVRVRDRVVSELVGDGEGEGDGEGDGAGQGSLVQALPIPSDSIGWTAAHRVLSSSSSQQQQEQLLPAWARAPEDQEKYLKWLRNPVAPENLPLRAFYSARERKVQLVVQSSQATKWYAKDFSRFVASLPTPLPNVTRLQLDEITFESEAHTVTNVFGGNLLILEPRVKGLARHADDAEGGFRVRLEIQPGNYPDGARSIVAALNAALVRDVVPVSRMDWGETPENTFVYNETAQSVTATLDLGMQFHQDAFELRWLSRPTAHFLGFNLNATARAVYLPGALRSTRAIEYSLDLQSRLNASTLKVVDGRATVRYLVVPADTDINAPDFSVSAWLTRVQQSTATTTYAKLTREVQLLQPGATYSYNSMVQSLRAALASDAVFGKHSFVQEMKADADDERPRSVLVLGLVPDPTHPDLRSWWNRPENAGRTVLVVDFALSDAGVWADPAAGCSFPVFARDEENAYVRMVPCLIGADAEYESENPLSVPSSAAKSFVWGGGGDEQEETTATTAPISGGSDDDGTTARVHALRNEARLLSDGAAVLSGLYLRSTSAAFRKMDRFVRLEPLSNYTATTLVAHAHQRLSATPFMGNSAVRIEPDTRRVKILVDVAYESKTFAVPPPNAQYPLFVDESAVDGGDVVVVARYLAATTTTATVVSVHAAGGASEITVETSGDGGLPAGASKYVLGKLKLTLLPSADSMDTSGIQQLVLEDWSEHSSVSTLVARINDVLAGASYRDPDAASDYTFGAVLAGSKLTILHAYRNSQNTKTLYKLRLALRATKIVTESLFELRLVDAGLWQALGFAGDSRVYSLSDPTRFDLDPATGLARAAVLADTAIEGSDSVLRLTSTSTDAVVVARLCVRGRHSTSAGDGSFPFPAPSVRGLDAAEPAETAYEVDLALPTYRDLSAGEIVTLFNAQILAAIDNPYLRGRFGPLLRWRDDQTARKVRLEALYTQRFDARDFNFVTYNPQLFSTCVAHRGMVSAGYLFSLGYTLGFRTQIEYDLSQPDRVRFSSSHGRPTVQLTGEVCADLGARKFYLSVSDACTSRPSATVLRLTPPFVNDPLGGGGSGNGSGSGGNVSSAHVLRSARAAAAASGVDCTNGLDDATTLGLQLDLTARGGSATNALTQRQLYAAAVAIEAETGRKRARAEMAGLGEGGYGSERFVLPKGQWAARTGDIGASVVTGGADGLASNLSVQNDLLTVFAPKKGSISFLDSGAGGDASSTAVRYYAGPVKLSTLQITVTDMYGAPAPISADWGLVFSAFCLPSSETADHIAT